MTTTLYPEAVTEHRTPDAAVAAVATGVRTTRTTKAVRVFAVLGVTFAVLGVVLLLVGNHTHNVIRDQLVAQQIQFPPADSPGMTAADYPGLQQYAGQLVDDGPKAKAWANEFMTPHILELSGGIPYGTYAATAFMNPTDEEMAATSKLMAIGEVQRGLLLSAWGWWTIGTVTWAAGLVLVIIAGLALIASAAFRIHSGRLPGETTAT